MPLSSDQSVPRGLDAMFIVYSLLDSHPASAACESFNRERTSWFTTTLTLLEVKAILTITEDKGVDITAMFHNVHRSVEDFEQKAGVQLPADIVALLTPP